MIVSAFIANFALVIFAGTDVTEVIVGSIVIATGPGIVNTIASTDVLVIEILTEIVTETGNETEVIGIGTVIAKGEIVTVTKSEASALASVTGGMEILMTEKG